MRYHPDDFLRLQEKVEEQGGTSSHEPCEPRKFRLKVPDAGGGSKYKEFFTAGCGLMTQFIVPYKKPDHEAADGGIIEGDVGTGVFCAVDDDMGRWPRFRDAIQEDSH